MFVLGEGWHGEGSASIHSTMFLKMPRMPSMWEVYNFLQCKKKKKKAYDSALLEKRLHGTDS